MIAAGFGLHLQQPRYVKSREWPDHARRCL
jgi:hypothetical protein